MAITLVLRLSSLGDVAILIPTLYSVALKNPDDKFLLMTKKPLLQLFVNKPDNLEIFPVHTKDIHKGSWGLVRFIWDIHSEIRRIKREDAVRRKVQVVDLHNVLRSAIVRISFWLKGAKIAVIDKGKKDKKALVRRKDKQFIPLKTSFERYRETFEDMGYDTSLVFSGFFPKERKKYKTWIGIAPFAKHTGKIYPPEKMETVIYELNKRPNTKIFLFGGKEESALLNTWTQKYRQVESIAGLLPFSEEFKLMNQLDLMVCMDSANMHLASLVNTPVVSIWGATHPYAGFYGYNQNPENAVQVDLDCRPCSVFGNRACRYGNYACLTLIRPETVLERIEKCLIRH
jgi:ADP-heptose:LPS heptosyltransferase